MIRHLTLDELNAGLAHIEGSPKDRGLLRLIVRRRGIEQREILEVGQLDTDAGLVGDTWNVRGSSQTVDGSSHPEKQLTIVNARAIALLAESDDRWALAGDQLFLDLDLTDENLPPGTCLEVGSAVIEVTAPPLARHQRASGEVGNDPGG